MKKLLTLACVAFAALSASAELPEGFYKGVASLGEEIGHAAIEGSTTAVELDVQDGDLVLIYDAHDDRYGFRNVTNANQIRATHQTSTAVTFPLDPSHIWIVEKGANGVAFKNLVNQQYIPSISDNTAANISTSVTPCYNTFEYPFSSGATTYKVHEYNTTKNWDGNPANEYGMCIGQGWGHPYKFYKVGSRTDNVYYYNSSWQSCTEAQAPNVAANMPYAEELTALRTIASNNITEIGTAAILANKQAGLLQLATADTQISTNAPYTASNNGDKFTSFSKLIDGNTGTYFHSDYESTTAPNEYHYLAYTFANTSATSFVYRYHQRNGNNRPTKYEIYGSTDGGSTWGTSPCAVLNISNDATAQYYEVPFTVDQAYNGLKFVVKTTTGGNVTPTGSSTAYPFFTLAEVQIYPSSAVPASDETKAELVKLQNVLSETASPVITEANSYKNAVTALKRAMNMNREDYPLFTLENIAEYPSVRIYNRTGRGTNNNDRWLTCNGNIFGVSSDKTQDITEFKLIPASDENPNEVYIYNVSTDRFMGSLANNSTAYAQQYFEAPQIYVVEPQDSHFKAFRVKDTADGTNSHIHLNGSSVCVGWNASEIHSQWAVAEDDGIDAMLTNIGKVADLDAAKTRANNLRSLLAAKPGVTTEQLAAFDTAVANATSAQVDDEATFQSLIDAINNAIDAIAPGFDGSVTWLTGKSINMESTSYATDYLAVNDSGTPRRLGGDRPDRRAWTLEPASNGYYLRNEFFNKYLKHAVGDGVASLVDNTTNATAYQLEAVAAGAEFKYALKSTVAGEAKPYLEQTTNDIKGTATIDDAKWTLTIVSDDVAAGEYLAGAIFSYGAPRVSEDKIGTEAGMYSMTGTYDYTTYNAAAAARADGVAATDRRAKADALRALLPHAAATWTINQPVDGKFYRLKRPGTSGDNSVYASCVANTSSKLPMITNNGAASVWMFKDGVLVSWVDGQIIGNFASGGNWGTGVSDATNVSTGVTFSEGSAVGTYYIEPTSGRHLHSANATVDCCGTAETNGHDDWVIEEVETNDTWIPIALPTDVAAGYKFALVSPLALNNYDGRLKFWTLDLVEGKVRQKEATSIPANTPVLCEYVKGYETAKESVFLPAGNTAMVPSSLEWSYFAKKQKGYVEATETTPAQSATHFMTWSGENFTRVANNDIIPGFAPYYEASDAAEAATPVEIAKPLADPVEELSIESVKLEGSATGYEFHIKGVSKHDDDHDMTLRIHRVNGPQAPQRRTPAAVQPEDGTGDYVLKHADFETNENNDGVYAVLGTKLAPGTYEISTDGEGFFKVGDDTTVMPQLKAVQLSVYSDGTTSIDELSTINHQLSPVYDLQGRKLAAPAKGINIIGGRKVLVK